MTISVHSHLCFPTAASVLCILNTVHRGTVWCLLLICWMHSIWKYSSMTSAYQGINCVLPGVWQPQHPIVILSQASSQNNCGSLFMADGTVSGLMDYNVWFSHEFSPYPIVMSSYKFQGCHMYKLWGLVHTSVNQTGSSWGKKQQQCNTY